MECYGKERSEYVESAEGCLWLGVGGKGGGGHSGLEPWEAFAVGKGRERRERTR